MPFSIRQFTREQAADGTTIDGNRMDKALGELLARFNGFTNGGVGLGKRDKARRWFQSQWVGGYTGRTDFAAATQRAAPWMFCFNGGPELLGWTSPNVPMNRYRNKGHRNDFIDPTLAPSTTSLRVWTHAFANIRPMIVTGIQLTMNVNGSGLNNTFVYGAGFPLALVGTPSQDIFVELMVDDPFAPEDRRLSNPEVHRQRFRADSVRLSPLTIPPGYANFLPVDARAQTGAGGRDGLHISIQNLNIPIPRDSRSRLSFVIPQYDNALMVSGWGVESHRRQGYSWSLTFLEEAL